MYCAKCGSQMGDSYRFCEECGEKNLSQSGIITKIRKHLIPNKRSLVLAVAILFILIADIFVQFELKKKACSAQNRDYTTRYTFFSHCEIWSYNGLAWDWRHVPLYNN